MSRDSGRGQWHDAGVASRADLEAAIAANPDDEEARLVYADMLQQQGDPRGELIMRCHRGAGVEAYLKAHRELWPYVYDVTWRLGFVDTIVLYQPDDEAARALRHPSCRFVREIRVCMALTAPETALAPIAAAVRPSVRTLTIAQDRMSDREGDWFDDHDHFGDHAITDTLWEALPDLRELVVEAGWDIFGRLEHPAIERIAIAEGVPFCTGRAPREPWHVPALRAVSWHYRVDCTGTGVATAPADFDPLWRADAPALREVDLRGAALHVRQTEPPLLATPAFLAVLPRLAVLRLPSHALGRTPAQIVDAVRAHADRLAHLEQFVLTPIAGVDGAALRALVPGFSW